MRYTPPSETQSCRIYLSGRNFALVEEQTVAFGPRLNVITGESGSGKSILLQALGQILGAPLAEDSIRAPATTATLEGSFVLAPTLRPILAFHLDGNLTAVSAALGGAGTSMFGGPVRLVLTREIIGRGKESGAGKGGDERRGGKARSVCKINGAMVPLKVLRRVGAMLVDVNGQNSQASGIGFRIILPSDCMPAPSTSAGFLSGCHLRPCCLEKVKGGGYVFGAVVIISRAYFHQKSLLVLRRLRLTFRVFFVVRLLGVPSAFQAQET